MPLRTTFAHDPADSAETRIEKTAILIIAGASCVAGLVWTGMYWVVLGWGLTAALPLVFIAIVGPALWVSHITRNHYWAVYAQIACIILITAFIQWSIGGLYDSGFVLAWALIGPLVALFFLRLRAAIAWHILYVVVVVVTVAFDDVFARAGQPVPDGTRALFFVMNIVVSSVVVFAFAGYFVTRARVERQRAESLLLNILPEAIAPRLKAGDETIADYHPEASILFADMVGSTPLFGGMDAYETVDWLNEAFTAFDRLVDRHGVEKIRTIGDNYMVAAGVPTPRSDHARVLVRLALDMRQAVDAIAPRGGKRMAFRFGLHTGPVIAGVIGESKFQYDVWGDTVNTASRMESHSEAGKIQISEATYALVGDHFRCEPRGTVEVKGKGMMRLWWVVG